MQYHIHNLLKQDTQDICVDVKDRAFNYGDGCFTTMYANGKTVVLLRAHIKRLVSDACRIGIDLNAESLLDFVHKACCENLNNESLTYVVKVLVSRGIGGRGYEVPQASNPVVHISFLLGNEYSPLLKPHDYLHSVGICSFNIAQQTILAGIKHLNRLEQIMAKKELAQCEHIDDLLMLDTNGYVIEATAANIFFFKDNKWCTPKLDNSGVCGVMRNAILAYLSNNNLAYEISNYSIADVIESKAMFTCNAVKFITAITSLKANTIIEFDTSRVSELATKVYSSLLKSAQMEKGE